METNCPNIFISYCWADSDIVDQIDNFFNSYGIKIIRDKRDIVFWESIKDFMKKIRNSDFCILVISDNYLKSKNCMFEVMEVMKDENYRHRILPLIIGSARVFTAMERVKYIKYWEQEYLKLSNSLDSIQFKEAIGDVLIDLKEIKEIQTNIGEFMYLISQMKNPMSIDSFCEGVKEKLFPNRSMIDNKYTLIKDFDTIKIVEIDSIIFCEAHSKRVHVWCADGDHVIVITKFEDMCQQLSSNKFIRCHRNYIVNIKFIDSLNLSQKSIRTINKYIIPISKSYYSIVKETIMKEYKSI